MNKHHVITPTTVVPTRVRPYRSLGLQVVLWVCWTIAVIITAGISWMMDALAHHPLDILGLVLRCAVAGVVGLIVMTKIEMWREPWRFIENDESFDEMN